MTKYANSNAKPVLANVEKSIEDIQHTWNHRLRIREVCDQLSIFDWWNDELSATQLKAMKSFLTTAIKLGYDGYVCFKVGAKYCASGMWAYKAESTDGYSPKGACIYRSFQSGGNYWDACDEDGCWLASCDGDYDRIRTARQLENVIKNA